MSRVVAGLMVAEVFTVLANGSTPAAMADITIVGAVAKLTSGTPAAPVVEVLSNTAAVFADGEVVVNALPPDDSVGKDLDITLNVSVNGRETETTHNVGIVTENLLGIMDQLQRIEDMIAMAAQAGVQTTLVLPLQAVVQGNICTGTKLSGFVCGDMPHTLHPTDAQGLPADLTGSVLEVVVEDSQKNDLVVIPDANITVAATSPYAVSFTVPGSAHVSVGCGSWSLRIAATKQVLMFGPYAVKYAAVAGP